MSPLPAMRVLSKLAAIWASLRAMFQMRASSSAPLKKPDARAGGRQRRAQGGVLEAGRVGLEGAREDERAIEHAVEVELPGAGSGVVGDRGVMPDVAGHDGHAADRVVGSGGLLVVGHQDAARGIDAQEVVGIDRVRRPSPSPAALVTSGRARAMPPVPVVTPTPAPSRRNQVSSVKLVTFSDGAAGRR